MFLPCQLQISYWKLKLPERVNSGGNGQWKSRRGTAGSSGRTGAWQFDAACEGAVFFRRRGVILCRFCMPQTRQQPIGCREEAGSGEPAGMCFECLKEGVPGSRRSLGPRESAWQLRPMEASLERPRNKLCRRGLPQHGRTVAAGIHGVAPVSPHSCRGPLMIMMKRDRVVQAAAAEP